MREACRMKKFHIEKAIFVIVSGGKLISEQVLWENNEGFDKLLDSELSPNTELYAYK